MRHPALSLVVTVCLLAGARGNFVGITPDDKITFQDERGVVQTIQIGSIHHVPANPALGVYVDPECRAWFGPPVPTRFGSAE